MRGICETFNKGDSDISALVQLAKVWSKKLLLRAEEEEFVNEHPCSGLLVTIRRHSYRTEDGLIKSSA